MNIVLANTDHLADVAMLFDHYRVFYHQLSNVHAAEEFIADRFRNQDSTIFLAIDEDSGVGFTQLYPSFSSVSMGRVWILNDLFVLPSHRQQGIATQLMQTAANYGRETGAIRLVLATEKTNTAAQALYESLGYQLDQTFNHFALTL
ncbi:GNAT family N-acetyltransferase [Acaryochloris marina]|uniref:Acetyltransferase n=1 Tax=Acaryochloris marina (strain MBIC 11017) TaxID=329726 RepID=B0CBK1_ACAM1|nr:GNAT family N-acetyltransferase [Acaryochloris marina]ABW29119.1 acetyltransferase [Acaryochloris marina MBIC11017]BDM78067.1 putative N-acetyltransferase YhfO [Acaryochloris marina MBIC10699]